MTANTATANNFSAAPYERLSDNSEDETILEPNYNDDDLSSDEQISSRSFGFLKVVTTFFGLFFVAVLFVGGLYVLPDHFASKYTHLADAKQMVSDFVSGLGVKHIPVVQDTSIPLADPETGLIESSSPVAREMPPAYVADLQATVKELSAKKDADTQIQ